jgi:hypothetical protein
MAAKVLLLEFNEICPSLLDNWFAAGKLPNFRRFYEQSDVFISTADETDPANLEPWIQWYSVHTGLPYAEHQVFHLTDGPRAGHMDLWRLVQQAGKSAMNCSSMNAKALGGDRAFFLPDPWCVAEACWPPELAIYAKVVAISVQEYSNTRAPLSWRDYADFLGFLAGHGLSPATVAAIVKQLVAEKLTSENLRWKRVSLLDRLQYDLFAHYYSRLRPDFATFFSNSTAHLQHAYWRHMDPAPFAIKPAAPERELYGDAVLCGYEAMDGLIGRFLELVDPDTVVILCSALSQQPFLKWEQKGGQHFYRLHDVSRLLAMLDASPVKVEPVMTHQYLVRFDSEEAMEAARDRLRALMVGGKALCGVEEAPDNSLEFGCQIFTSLTGDEVLTGIPEVNRPVRFNDLFYAIQAVKSGCHHPDGVLWVRTGRHRVHPGRVSILDIAPTICGLLQLDPSGLQCAGPSGTSLLDRIALTGLGLACAA